MQRNFDTFEIPSNIYPVEVTTNRESIDVTWSDKHNSSYSWKFLQYYQNNDYRAPEDIKPSLWGAEDVSQPSPGVPYDRVMADDRGVAELTSKIRKYGFAFVKGTPYDDPKYTKELLERIAFIRETHYGGFYDFTPDLAMADTAYTNLALPPHTDTTYFTDPAGLQAFHLLSHVGPPQAPPTTDETPSSSSSSDDNPTAHYEGRGGSSLLIDGFYAAEILRTKFPSAYEILSTVRLPWHASGNPGITIAPDQRFPVLELDKDTGKLHRIRWNNDDRGVVPWDEKYDPTAWYRAARRWANILKRKDVRYWVQLEPGKPLIFDNWRVLHGRSAFTGTRRICGAYINRDDFISRWRNTNFPREQILTRIIG
ncbi:trimethyllysine dioxygenase [Cercophora scortea]|uniref:trimethyllysine dioxygenase n=1 Tax=Cercophora scortea TaxID=314031 RepID=A0AAE0IMJ8_9PEZI|nr:trimethyllysine dioxygenase [Cercophora scortea]